MREAMRSGDRRHGAVGQPHAALQAQPLQPGQPGQLGQPQVSHVNAARAVQGLQPATVLAHRLEQGVVHKAQGAGVAQGQPLQLAQQGGEAGDLAVLLLVLDAAAVEVRQARQLRQLSQARPRQLRGQGRGWGAGGSNGIGDPEAFEDHEALDLPGHQAMVLPAIGGHLVGRQGCRWSTGHCPGHRPHATPAPCCSPSS